MVGLEGLLYPNIYKVSIGFSGEEKQAVSKSWPAFAKQFTCD